MPKFSQLVWLVPAFLFALCLHQIKVVYDMQQTIELGQPAIATITEYKIKRMAAQTHGLMTLRVFPGDSSASFNHEISVPPMIMTRLEGMTELEVRILAGGGQKVIMLPLVKVQMRTAMVNAAMSFIGFLIVIFGIQFIRKKDRSTNFSEAS